MAINPGTSAVLTSPFVFPRMTCGPLEAQVSRFMRLEEMIQRRSTITMMSPIRLDHWDTPRLFLDAASIAEVAEAIGMSDRHGACESSNLDQFS
ncbi:hypothetical protein [Rhizorhabdus argentea]|uniref:hypothetical protein n=1 Tax=Rhizorhabdus argentea TaxID=1387174 RepID=UPI0030EC3CFE